MRSHRVLAALLAGTLACDHSSPFSPGRYPPTGPLVLTSPVQLTFSPGHDITPSWLPDGSGILYSFQRLDRFDQDRCLGVLPFMGGARTRTMCPGNDGFTEAFVGASVWGNQIALFRSGSRIGAVAPDTAALIVAPLSDPTRGRVLRTFPWTTEGRDYSIADPIRWLDASSVVFVGQALTYPRACSSCLPDTVETGVAILRAFFNDQSVTLLRVPNTDNASSLAVAGSDTIYYTLEGDSRVLRQILSTGQVTTAHTFLAPARDVDVQGTMLVAVVGGLTDRGGDLWRVNLSTGASGPLPSGGGVLVFRRPAIDPSRRFVVAQAVDSAGIVPEPDLWVMVLP